MSIDQEMEYQLHKFLHGSADSGMLRGVYSALNLRTGVKKLNEGMFNCLTILEVDVDKRYRRMGIFKDLLQIMEDATHFEAVYVDTIINPHLEDFLVKRGYHRLNSDRACYMYKFRHEIEEDRNGSKEHPVHSDRIGRGCPSGDIREVDIDRRADPIFEKEAWRRADQAAVQDHQHQLGLLLS